jgi:hypothetical protein
MMCLGSVRLVRAISTALLRSGSAPVSQLTRATHTQQLFYLTVTKRNFTVSRK